MFERFTKRARQVIVFSQAEARSLKHDHIGVEHILLGLLLEKDGTAAHVLEGLHVSVDLVRARIVQRLVSGEKAPSGQIPLTPRAKLALELSLREALTLGHNFIGTEHILLGLVHQDEGPAIEILHSFEVDKELVRAAVMRVLSGPEGRREMPGTPQARREEPQGASLPEAEALTQPKLELDAVPTHSDRPATEDELGRARLAEVLAERIRRVRGEDTESQVRTWQDRRTKLKRDCKQARRSGSFMIHIHAPWGAGKSSLLNFLATDLRNLRQRPDRGLLGAALGVLGPRRAQCPDLSQWIVMEFNAWKHQRLEPPWWWLLAKVGRSCKRDLWRMSRGRWAWFWLRDIAWRLWNARAQALAVLLIAGLVLFAKTLKWFGLENSSLTALQATAVSASALIAFGTILWTWIRGTSRWLAIGSARGAMIFLQRAQDPLEVYRKRYRSMVRAAGRPIAVFIDDLDRCKPDYVVQLLEGIQTLFAGEPVTYVVAADRTWLCESFGKAYIDFNDAVGEPGRPLGFLFLEKTFQVSMEIPPMTFEERRRYWRRLMRTLDQPPETSRSPRVELTDAFSSAYTHEEVDMRMNALLEGGMNEDDVLRAAVRRLNAPDLQAQLEDLLNEFAPLLENNPRSMKRLVNAYGIECDRLLREGRQLSREERRQLVLFTILRLRWPLFAEYLLKRPEDATLFMQDVDHRPNGTPFADLYGDREVRALFDSSLVDVKLDPDLLARYAGRGPERTLSVGA